jgi:hypothetical protein
MFIHKIGKGALIELHHIKSADSQFNASREFISFFFEYAFFPWMNKYFHELIKYLNINESLYLSDINVPRPVDINCDYDFTFSGVMEFNYK